VRETSWPSPKRLALSPRLSAGRTLFAVVARWRTRRVCRVNDSHYDAAMCNLYSLTKGQAAIIALRRAMRDVTGNLPVLPGIFPDYRAPIVRTAADGVRELTMARWGNGSRAKPAIHVV
jgi:hypothetical protein